MAWVVLGIWTIATVVFSGSMAGAGVFEPQPLEGQVTMTAGPRWGRANAGEWTAYTVSIRNGGDAQVDGDVILVPEKAPPPTPGKPEAAPPSPSPPPWPTYRIPATLYGGGAKTLPTVLLESPFGYRAELRDSLGKLLASAPATEPDPARYSVALLSRVPDARALLEGTPGLLQNRLAVTQFTSGSDFPDEALALSGLDVVVLDDFDTGTLEAAQMEALSDFVSLGGSLVVAGGAASSRTVGPLPPALAPLHPLSTAETSLAPLGDLFHRPTAATTPVTAGEIRDGRAVLGAKGQPPLVVESGPGAGHLVQLAYDPLSESFASDPMLRAAAWEQGFTRVLPSGGFASQKPSLTPDNKFGPLAVAGLPAESAQAAPRIRIKPDPLRPWSRWRLGLLLAFLVLAPGYFVSVIVRWQSRGPRPFQLATASVVVIATVAAALVVGPSQPVPSGRVDLVARSETVFEIETLGGNGAVLKTTYQQLANDIPVVTLNGDAAATTILVAPPRDQAIPVDLAHPYRPGDLATYDTGGGEVAGGADLYELRRGEPPSRVRALHTIAVEHGHEGLDADLHRVGGSERNNDAGRLVGTVTNRGSRPLYRLRAQIGGGQAALLGDVVAPGAAIEVDAPLVTPPQWCFLPTCPPSAFPSRVRTEDAAMFTAGNAAMRNERQIALVGLLDGPVLAPGPQGEMPPIRIAVQPVTLAAVASGSNQLRPIAGGGGISLEWAAFEFTVPPGATTAAAVEFTMTHATSPPPSIEVFDWETESWRPLRPPLNQDDLAVTRLLATELRDGTVRMRADPPSAPSYLELDFVSTDDARGR